MSEKTYVVEEYTPSCTCPICGGKMTPAEYYVTRMDVSVNVDNSKVFTVAKTTTAQFHNLRRKIGGLCVPCYVKNRQGAEKDFRILAIALCALVLGALAFFLWYLTRDPAGKAALGGAPVAAIGVAVAAGYFAVKNFRLSRNIRSHWTTVADEGATTGTEWEVRENTRSSAFVTWGKEAGFGSGETLLTRGQVKRMEIQMEKERMEKELLEQMMKKQ